MYFSISDHVFLFFARGCRSFASLVSLSVLYMGKGRDAGGLRAQAHDAGLRTGSVVMALSASTSMMLSVMSGCRSSTCEKECGLSGCSSHQRHTKDPAVRVWQRAPSIFFVGGTHGMCARAADQSRSAAFLEDREGPWSNHEKSEENRNRLTP